MGQNMYVLGGIWTFPQTVVAGNREFKSEQNFLRLPRDSLHLAPGLDSKTKKAHTVANLARRDSGQVSYLGPPGIFSHLTYTHEATMVFSSFSAESL